jgi:hypothetical protein
MGALEKPGSPFETNPFSGDVSAGFIAESQIGGRKSPRIKFDSLQL